MREYIIQEHPLFPYDPEDHPTELIRCKDCRFYHPSPHINETYCDCEVGMIEPYDNGYCSYAEKGEE